MGLDVGKELAALKAMTVPELRARYAEVFGEECRSRHKQFLWKRIIWRMQANKEGGLSERARRRAEELANDADLRIHAPKAPVVTAVGVTIGRLAAPADSGMPLPGTLLTRQYKGRLVQVLVREKGFEYEGTVYRSLSAVAHAVTGSHWSGHLFFNLGRKEAQTA
jgi:hypothetical protein